MTSLLITGATGALGPPLVMALLETRRVERLTALLRVGEVEVAEKFAPLIASANTANPEANRLKYTDCIGSALGDIRSPNLGFTASESCRLQEEVEVVVHAAADTRFRAPAAEQRHTNVEGTQHVLDWAANCRNLRHVVLVSTTCVAGRRTGEILEQLEPVPPQFVNHYEQTKWQAEQLAVASGLPVTIVRLATCAGSEVDGSIHRLGGLHHGLRWMLRGLVPMLPGDPDCSVDLISSELAAQFIARASVGEAPSHAQVCHVSACATAPTLAELLEEVVATFRQLSSPWSREQIAPPSIVNERVFAAFCETVAASRDLLFQEVIQSVDAFLPTLLYPKTYRTDNACRLWGGPLPHGDWRHLVRRVIAYCISTQWGREPSASVSHA